MTGPGERISSSIVLALASLVAALGCAKVQPERMRIAGEFEPIETLLLAWNGDAAETLEQVIAIASPRLPTVVVVDPSVGAQPLLEHFDDLGIDTNRIDVLEAPTEAVWMRDFGPITVVGDRGTRLFFDFEYPYRPASDQVPRLVVDSLWPGSKIVQPAMEFDGGNLVSDGAGVCVTASGSVYGPDPRELRSLLRDHGACNTLIEVPSLEGEPTGHVDMTVFSPGPGHMVVGEYLEEQDSVNKEVLDSTAATLRDAGMVVTRLPMPDHNGVNYPSYTNLLVLNDLVLVPVYTSGAQVEKRALRIISTAFPGREIIPVEADDSINLEGALHCLAQTVPVATWAPAASVRARSR